MKVCVQGLILVLNLLIFGGLCYNDTNIGELPPGIASQLLSMLTKQAIQVTGGCKNATEDDIELLLYTRETFGDPTVLNITNPTDIDSNKKTVILIHGWISGQNGYGIADLRDAYLKRYDCNLILVDWSKMAWELYTASVCSLPKISQMVADFLCLLDKHMDVSLSSVHLVGHSLGGQMSGLIGKETLAKCKKRVGRITALDPAGPLYQNVKSSNRLDRTDADFVDVIHTNEGALGYWGNCGDVDFHVNCGVMQLGCPDIKLDVNDIKDMPMEIASCHHFRSLDYMTESITSDSFQARVCGDCPLPCIPNFFRSTEIIMGEDCSEDGPTGAYVLATHFESPYGLGSTKILNSLADLF